MPKAIINNTHLTFSEDTRVITQSMTQAYQDTVTHITIPEGVTKIDSNVLPAFNKLITIQLPDSLMWIGSPFTGCSSLTTILVPNMSSTPNLNEPPAVEDGAFRDQSSLIIPTPSEGPTWIEKNTFASCDSLQCILIPKSLEGKSLQFWQDKGINTEETEILTQSQLQQFTIAMNIDSPTGIEDIITLFLAHQQKLSLPEEKIHLKDYPQITKLSLANLCKPLIFAGFPSILPRYCQETTQKDPNSVLQTVLSPLGSCTKVAANHLASLLSWKDAAPILLTRKTSSQALQLANLTPYTTEKKTKLVQCAEESSHTPRHPNHVGLRTSYTNLAAPRHP